MESIPVGEVLFFRDEIKASSAHDHALRMMAFIMCVAQAPLVCHFVDIKPVSFLHLIGDIAHMLYSLLDDINSLLSAVLEL